MEPCIREIKPWSYFPTYTDPTAGGAIGDVASWCFDGAVLENKLQIALRRFCAPKSVFYSDLGSLYSNVPSVVEEFNCLLFSLRNSNEPRGVWDLLSVISGMLRRDDKNGVPLLEVLTRCMLDVEEACYWLLVYWSTIYIILISFYFCFLVDGVVVHRAIEPSITF